MEEEKRSKIREVLGGKTLCIEGNIGVGKTEFMKNLANYLEKNQVFQKVSQYQEEIPVDILKGFNKDPKKYSLLFQKAMMVQRLLKNTLALENQEESSFSIVDTGMLRELAFSRANNRSGFMQNRQYKCHIADFLNNFNKLNRPLPHFLVLLEANTDILQNRIHARRRDGEGNLDEGYLSEITEAHRYEYTNPILSNGEIKKLKICTDTGFFSPEEFIEAILN